MQALRRDRPFVWRASPETLGQRSPERCGRGVGVGDPIGGARPVGSSARGAGRSFVGVFWRPSVAVRPRQSPGPASDIGALSPLDGPSRARREVRDRYRFRTLPAADVAARAWGESAWPAPLTSSGGFSGAAAATLGGGWMNALLHAGDADRPRERWL